MHKSRTICTPTSGRSYNKSNQAAYDMMLGSPHADGTMLGRIPRAMTVTIGIDNNGNAIKQRLMRFDERRKFSLNNILTFFRRLF